MDPQHSRAFRVGIDVGGTFTDIVATGSDGRILVRKVASTTGDLSLGSSRGVSELLNENAIRADEVDVVVHATTTATNAVLEGKGARTALITTAGFRDILEFRRVRVPELYNLGYVKPAPLVPRSLRFEVSERLGPLGEIWRPLDEDSVRVAAARIQASGAEAVAICLLHSYVNPEHEKRVRAIVEEMLGDKLFVTCSHEILPEMREYERTSTTVINAYLGPVMKAYLQRLEERLTGLGTGRSLHVMTSGGGQMSLKAAMNKPAYLVESGPAAGVIAAARIAKRLDLPNIITLDMGGTTAKTAIVEHAEPAKTSEFEVGAGINLSSKLVRGAGYAIKLPFIDVSEIGAGGGSKIWFDKGGVLKVGPESAGSEPGPVCYGKGGTVATLTDAFLTLGYVNSKYLVGGALGLEAGISQEAVRAQVAEPLGIDLRDAAYGAVTVAVANMVRAVKSVSTYRGRDPRGYTLIAFGGNGPLVGAMIAHELSMPRVLVPPHSGVLSAYGLLMADHEQELVRSYPARTAECDPAALNAAYEELSREAVDTLSAEGFAPQDIEVRRFADLRYVGQAYELTVPVAGTGVPVMAEVDAAFHEEHRKTYSHMSKSEPVGLVSIRIVASVRTPQPAEEPADAPEAAADAPPVTRDVYFGAVRGLHAVPVLRRAGLREGERAGPLLVEEYDSTCLVPPGATARVDRWNNIVITLEPRA
ncbi:hydantoinase/oxoprolinase family protein [Bosea sp. RAC05]|uniref:hydantoinase/oxoprolinase family protein n=1 Tax=Bosea sp. RAC05 TaxID=1842539 RepID=UPI00083CDF17|nr:hydantoinase/oxoprolinase family protein [Bosea sp. RAC05]AOG03835.1 hydantoinase/oxoprolinase family protein [Bosea sp. RAC05]